MFELKAPCIDSSPPPTQQKSYNKLNLLNFYFQKYIILFASAYNIALPEHLNAFGKLKSRGNPVFRSQKGKIFMFFFKDSHKIFEIIAK